MALRIKMKILRIANQVLIAHISRTGKEGIITRIRHEGHDEINGKVMRP